MRMLIEGDHTFHAPTRVQRRNLAMAFAARDKIIYGRAFDAVRFVEKALRSTLTISLL